MKARKIKDIKTCEVEGCINKSTDMVFSRKSDAVIICCEAHADVIVDEDNPEYHDQCMNCGCRQGVN